MARTSYREALRAARHEALARDERCFIMGEDVGVASVFGVIYPPQVALVGLGRIAARPLAAEGGGGVRVAPMLTATLAADHRASDGHLGALLLAEIRQWVQDPDALDRPWTSTAPMPVPKP